LQVALVGQYLESATPEDELLLDELLEEELLELELLDELRPELELLEEELLDEELELLEEELLEELELEEEGVPVQADSSNEPNRVRHRADNLGEVRMLVISVFIRERSGNELIT
jgi:hypothetical protein